MYNFLLAIDIFHCIFIFLFCYVCFLFLLICLLLFFVVSVSVCVCVRDKTLSTKCLPKYHSIWRQMYIECVRHYFNDIDNVNTLCFHFSHSDAAVSKRRTIKYVTQDINLNHFHHIHSAYNLYTLHSHCSVYQIGTYFHSVW